MIHDSATHSPLGVRGTGGGTRPSVVSAGPAAVSTGACVATRILPILPLFFLAWVLSARGGEVGAVVEMEVGLRGEAGCWEGWEAGGTRSARRDKSDQASTKAYMDRL